MNFPTSDETRGHEGGIIAERFVSSLLGWRLKISPGWMVFIVAPFGFSRCFIFHFPDVSRKGARKCLFVKRRKGGNVRRKV